jgi:hypothetical protein
MARQPSKTLKDEKAARSDLKLGRYATCDTSARTYRGFERKGGCVHIITFRVTTKLQSKSNRCI